MKRSDIKLKTQTAQIFENVTSECDKTYNAIITNNNLKQFLYTDFETLTKKDIYTSYSTVRNLLTSNVLASSYISNIIVISDKNETVVSANEIGTYSYKDFSDFPWYNKLKKGNSPVFSTSEIAKETKKAYGQNNMVICRSINFPYEDNYMLFIINTETVKNDIYKFLPEENAFYLFKDDILISSDNNSENINLEKANKLYNNEAKISKYDVYTKEIPPYSYKMVLMLENIKYKSLFARTIIIFVIIALLSLLLIYWLSYTLAKNTMKPISNIIKILEDPTNANSALKLHNSPEMQFITKNILKSLDDNVLYKDQLEKKLSELNDALEITLRTQIQPHFLFNTLETIQAVTFDLTKSKNTAYEMIGMLASLLKISFRNDSKFILIKEELKHIQSYINIQNIRYSNFFETKWDIDEDCLKYSTLKLILQPIVENAIYHGVKNCNHFCYIKISIKESANKECVVFSVENNGKMIDSETLERLKKILNEEMLPSPSHIGLSNVNKRIRIAFGKQYGCTIESTQEKTVVNAIIPKTIINQNN